MSHSEAPPSWAMEKAREAMGIAESDVHPVNILKPYWDAAYQGVARALAEADRSATERERERLNSMPKSWELSCENEDSSDLSTDLVWKVHAVHGGLNDREWSLLGKGDTPSNAIEAAFIAAAIRGAGHE